MKDRISIQDLKRPGQHDRFTSVFLAQSKEVRTGKSGAPYLTAELTDRSGRLDARMWDNVESAAGQFEAGGFIEVEGRIQEYRGKAQIIIHKLRPVPENEVQIADFVPHTKYDVDEMYDRVLAVIDGFTNPDLKRLLQSIFRNPRFADAYKRAPAARMMHHAVLGGLLEHVSSLLKLAEHVASHYDHIDHDLLASGVLLHDLGKLKELRFERTIEFSDEGRLLGHIAIGSAWIGRRCDEIKGFPPRLKTLLLHMILSHHGKLEFGSPQVPMFPEAMALHYIDDLDSKMEVMRAACEDIAEGQVWSQYHSGLSRFVLHKEAYLAAAGASVTPSSAPVEPPPNEPARAEEPPPAEEPAPVEAAAPEEVPAPAAEADPEPSHGAAPGFGDQADEEPSPAEAESAEPVEAESDSESKPQTAVEPDAEPEPALTSATESESAETEERTVDGAEAAEPQRDEGAEAEAPSAEPAVGAGAPEAAEPQKPDSPPPTPLRPEPVPSPGIVAPPKSDDVPPPPPLPNLEQPTLFDREKS